MQSNDFFASCATGGGIQNTKGSISETELLQTIRILMLSLIIRGVK